MEVRVSKRSPVAKVAHLTRVLLKLQRVSRRTVAIQSQVLRSVCRIISMTHEALNGTSLRGEVYAQVGNVRGSLRGCGVC